MRTALRQDEGDDFFSRLRKDRLAWIADVLRNRARTVVAPINKARSLRG